MTITKASKDMIRGGLRKIGMDLVTYPTTDPAWRVARLLDHYGFDNVVDVGANDGDYANGLRQQGYRGDVWSFEPLEATFARLQERSKQDPRWHLRRCALGENSDRVSMHVASNSEASSSMLPMLAAHVQAAPSAVYSRDEEVRVERLDDLPEDLSVSFGIRNFLKMDVQGYEARVLRGAEGLLSNGTFDGVQMELSFIPLYEDSLDWREAVDQLLDLGMVVVGMYPGFADLSTGQLLQADVVAMKEELARTADVAIVGRQGR